jgi:hypothetical protein
VIFGRLMFVGGEGKVQGHLHAREHPWMDESQPEMVGGGLPMCNGEPAAVDMVARCALARPVTEQGKERADEHR